MSLSRTLHVIIAVGSGAKPKARPGLMETKSADWINQTSIAQPFGK
jgi:hypothetical protein